MTIVYSLNTINQQHLNNVDKDITTTDLGLDSNTYNNLFSIRDIWKVYVAYIIAEIGNIDRLSHNSKLAKYSKFYWKRNQSKEYNFQDKKSSTSFSHILYLLLTSSFSI